MKWSHKQTAKPFKRYRCRDGDVLVVQAVRRVKQRISNLKPKFESIFLASGVNTLEQQL